MPSLLRVGKPRAEAMLEMNNNATEIRRNKGDKCFQVHNMLNGAADMLCNGK